MPSIDTLKVGINNNNKKHRHFFYNMLGLTIYAKYRYAESGNQQQQQKT